MARPNLSYLKNLILFLLGLPSGMITGLTSIANSIFLAPAIRYLLGLRPMRVHGSVLAVTFFSALGSLLSYQQNHDIDWRLVLIMVMGQIIGVTAAKRFLSGWSAPGARTLWAFLIIVGGVGMIANARGIGPAIPALSGEVMAVRLLLLLSLAMLTAILVGVISQITGFGGLFLAPAGIYLLHFSPLVSQGTAIAVLLVSSLPAMILHGSRGNIDLQSAFPLSLGAIFGGLIGAYYAIHFRPDALVFLYGAVMIFAGLILFLPRKSTAPPNAENTE